MAEHPEHAQERTIARLRRQRARWREWADIRARWWAFLDAWETGWRFRIKVLGGVTLSAAVITAGLHAYPLWREHSTLRMARQWMDAGRPDKAEPLVQLALTIAPSRVEAWTLASELALQSGRPKSALAFIKHAANLAPNDENLALDHAAMAMSANEWEEARAAVAGLSETAARSARGSRLSGELARRDGDVDTAIACFEKAGRAEPAQALNEVPLGVTLLAKTEPAARERGRALLEKWAGDPKAGAEALRVLLLHAMQADEREAMRRLGKALQAHPAATLHDRLNSLGALLKDSPAEYERALAAIQERHAQDEEAAAGLIEWLTGAGRGESALAWARTLSPEFTRRPPVTVAMADSLRVQQKWAELKRHASGVDWGRLNLLRTGYEWMAERKLGEAAVAQRSWESLVSGVPVDGGEALFVAGALYSWGLQDDAVKLWWRCAEQPGVAIPALGSLARHYQMKRDADGLYRAFSRLHGLRGNDPLISNNFAYLSLILDRGREQALRIARENHRRYPDDRTYRATYGYALKTDGRVSEALEIFAPLKESATGRANVALAYGLTLAKAGRTDEAKSVLGEVDHATLTDRESQLLADALKRF